jgi:hypothetical protein
MGNVIKAFDCVVLTLEQKRIYENMEKGIVDLVNTAKNAGVPQGLIVALLHGYANYETGVMMDDA